MKRFVATKRGYIRRLRQMLKDEHACCCCPLYKGFQTGGHPNMRGHLNDYQYYGSGQVCEWCQDFIGLKDIRTLGSAGNYDRLCPCRRLGNEALKRAHLALEQWDNGTHKWQTE